MHYKDDLRRESFEQGLHQGIAEGKFEGEHEKTLKIAKNMLSEGMKVDFIAKVTLLPKEEILYLTRNH